MSSSSSTQHSSIFSLSLLFLFFSLSLYHYQFYHISQTLPSNSTQHCNNYILRFREYNTAHHHRAYLQSNLPFQSWRWVDRRNPAAKCPTDFGLVSVDDSVKDWFTRQIRTLTPVKDVHVDMGYTRGLLNRDRSHKGATFLDGKKRPGKIFTSMSFSDGDGDADEDGGPHC